MKTDLQLTEEESNTNNSVKLVQIDVSRPVRRDKKIPRTVQFERIVLETIEAHMKRERIENFSVTVNDAIKYALFPGHKNDREGGTVKLLNQIIYSLNEHRRKTSRDMVIFQEILVRFIHEYFMHTHQIPDSAKEGAEAQANLRLDAFMEQIIRRLPTTKQMDEGDGT